MLRASLLRKTPHLTVRPRAVASRAANVKIIGNSKVAAYDPFSYSKQHFIGMVMKALRRELRNLY